MSISTSISICLLLLLPFISQAQKDWSLIQRLSYMVEESEKCRTIQASLEKGEAQKISLSQAQRNKRSIDSTHNNFLQHFIEKNAYPGFDKIGRSGAHDFWVLLKHQDNYPTFQQIALKLMHKAVLNKKASASDYAFLLDLVLINTGKKQRYGTQLQLNAAKNSFEPKALEDSSLLNEKRKKMGLPSIDFAIARKNKQYFGQLDPKNKSAAK